MKKSISILLLLVFISSFAAFLKTQLTLTVRDETGNVVAGASIKLYSKKEDWEKEVNHFAEMTSDAKGVAKFKEVKYLNIYLLVRKGDKDNTGGGEQTKLEEGKFNKVTLVIQ